MLPISSLMPHKNVQNRS